MNDKFDNQKETLASLSHEISLLQQQVKYLLRNEKAAELLDLDVLMNRTHTIYDMICSISVGENEDEQDFDIDPDALTALFGGMAEEKESQIEEPLEETEQEPEEPAEELPEMNEVVEQPEQEPEEPVEEEPVADEDEPVIEEAPAVADTPQPEETTEEPVAEEEPQPEQKKQEGDDFGLFFRFEDIPLKQDEPTEEGKVEEKDGKTIHFMDEVPIEEIPVKDRVDGDNLITDDPFKMPAMEDEIAQVTTPEESTEDPQPIVEQPTTSPYGNYFEKDDMGFEISTNETLGESMISDDNSLAAKFQQAPVNDLKSAIGLNDKFLFVNELFGGSMEKYNKSIDNLNDLKTLNGAMIYLNELKIELQWNSSNEAYKKLWEKVAQKFNA